MDHVVLFLWMPGKFLFGLKHVDFTLLGAEYFYIPTIIMYFLFVCLFVLLCS